MAQIRFANNVSTQLTKPVTADDSTIEVRSLTHGLVWPNISATGDYFLIVIDDISSSTWEIMKCTKVQVNGSATVLTVERGLEGTTATTFNAGSVVENRLTAGTLDTFGEGFPAKVEINRGGTGATTAADARTNLDVPSKADLSSEASTRTSEVARLDQKITDNIPPAATTSVRGTTTLSSAVDSVSEAMAATPKAVKTAYDAAVSAKSGVDTVDARVTDEVNTLTANIEAVQSSCAPTSHASSSTTYGLATNTNYGHVRGDGETTDVVAGEIVVKDVLFNNRISLTSSGLLGKARYIGSSVSFNIDTDDFDLILVNGENENSLGTYPPFTGFVYIRQYYFSRTSPTNIGNRIQVAFAYSMNGMWRRYHLNGSWSNWVKVIDRTDIATTSTPGLVKPGTGTSIAGDGSLNVNTATTSVKGIVQLSSATNSESELVAATSKAVKAAYDKAVEAADAVSSMQAFEVGELRVSFADSLEGCLLCDGSVISRTTYSALFDVIGTTFGAGDGSTTFALPNYIGRTIQGASTGTVGTVIEAGLPNISAQFWAYAVGWVNAGGTGPFYNAGAGPEQGTNGGAGGTCCKWGFDMSRANAIYGKSGTVQPPAIVANIFIKY